MCGRFALGRGADELAHDLQQQLFGADDGGAPEVEQEQEEEATPDDEAEQDDYDAAAQEALDELEGGPVASGSSGAGASTSAAKKQAAQKGSRSKGSQVVAGQKTVDWSSDMVKSRFRKRYNIPPKSYSPVIRRNSPMTYKLDSLQWGLIPGWSKEPPTSPQHTINATCEKLFEGGGLWGSLRDKKRCVVVADGFFEWKQGSNSKSKLAHFVKPKKGKLMMMAGLWDKADYKGAFDEVSTFTIITVPVSNQLRFLHHRMPALLETPEEVALWLSETPWSPAIKALVRTYEDELEYYQVPPEVGTVGKDSPDFIQPLAKKKGTLSNMFAKQLASSPPKNPAPSKLDEGTPGPSSSSASSASMKKSISASSAQSTSSSRSTGSAKPKVKKEGNSLKSKAKAMARTFSEVIELSSDDEDSPDEEDIKKKAKATTPVKKKVKLDSAEAGKVLSPAAKAKAALKDRADNDGNTKVDSFFKKEA